MTLHAQTPLGWWSADDDRLALDPVSISDAIHDVNTPLMVIEKSGRLGLVRYTSPAIQISPSIPDSLPVRGFVPACQIDCLGDATFRRDHGIRYAYVSGAMAAGIGSEQIAEQMAAHGMLGFFGSAGLSPTRVESAIERLSKLSLRAFSATNAPTAADPRYSQGRVPYGFNLIHSPNEQSLERSLVDLYLHRNVHLVEASAYLDLTPHIVRYRLHGIHRDASGQIVTPNQVIAKVSRIEVGNKFFAPASPKMLSHLVDQGMITVEQAKLAEQVPIAQDITAEADSGGHTDNRPALTLLPTILALRDRAMSQYRFAQPLRVGAAGGIATPASAAAAFAMGAAYILVGSVQQACVESGTCDTVRQMLAEAEQADVTMCPCADMFEMGVKVQVLKRGTMFPMRAAKLYEVYRNHKDIDDIPAADRQWLEKNLFRTSLEDVWRQTVDYFATRDPSEIARGERDPKHKMALIFRWYLGQSSRWANSGEPTRRMDYQIWCGPAMGAFNEWTRGTFLAEPANRKVATIAHNLLHGAAVMQRLNALRYQGFPIPIELERIAPSEHLNGELLT